jgi:hypothetical protein
MVRTTMMTGLVLAVTMLTVSVGSAEGAAESGSYSFHDCVGPTGTPTSFTAVKEQLPPSAAHGASAGVAFLVSDGSGVFIALQFGDTTIGKGIPAGRLTTTCQVDFAPPAGTLLVSGFLTPSGG